MPGAKGNPMCTQPARTALSSFDDLQQALIGIAPVQDNDVEILDEAAFPAGTDRLVYTAVFGGRPQGCGPLDHPDRGSQARRVPASIHDLYMAAGRGIYSNATAPAINVRGMTAGISQAIFRAAKADDCKNCSL